MSIPEAIVQLKTQLELTTGEQEQAEILMRILDIIAHREDTDVQTYIDRLRLLGETLKEPLYQAWGIYYLGLHKRLKGDYTEAQRYTAQALTLFEQLGQKKGLSSSYTSLAVIYYHYSNFKEALKNYFAALLILEEIGDKPGIASLYNFIGRCYRQMGDFPESLKNYFAALKASEDLNDKPGIATSCNNIASIYGQTSNYPEALKYVMESIEINKETGSDTRLSLSYVNAGNIFYYQQDFPQALNYFFKSIQSSEKVKDKEGVACAYNNIANVYIEQGKYTEALDNLFAALKIKEDLDEKPSISVSLNTIGKLYKKKGDYPEAMKYLFEALKLSQEIGSKVCIKESYYTLYEIYSEAGEFEKALDCYKKYHELEKETLGSESQKQLTNLSFMHDLEQKEKQLEIEQLQNQEKQKELEIEYLRNVELKKERDHINVLYDTIEEEKKKVEQKNTEIIQSINYAEKIQSAILPSPSRVKQLLPESFILYMPKDIVSGDFYWMEEIRDARQGGDKAADAFDSSHSSLAHPSSSVPRILFAACDCTGHGVPGAMVSLVCYNALNRAVHEYHLSQPSMILDKVCDLVVETFKTSDEDVKDGMDISLCALDTETMTLQWSGANNPLWLLRGDEILETKADKQPIGHSDYGKLFTNHTVKLKPGDIIYVFSDGYADQFGGPSGKKLTKKKMRQLLLEMRNEPLAGQEKRLKDFILAYQNDTFQIDDILLIGVKIDG